MPILDGGFMLDELLDPTTFGAVNVGDLSFFPDPINPDITHFQLTKTVSA
jgi:hypothetical protein